jgi:MerR family transcriptional regulator/heat shock protein HspR
MNLAGVERVFELEAELERMQRRARNLERHAERMEGELRAEIERVRRSYKRELVVYQPPPERSLAAQGPVVRVPVRRPAR